MKFQQNSIKKLIIQPRFDDKLVDILKFGIDNFGAKVAYDFYKNVMNAIIKLPSMPDIHPKNRFAESTDRKIYRNILIEKYSILFRLLLKQYE